MGGSEATGGLFEPIAPSSTRQFSSQALMKRSILADLRRGIKNIVEGASEMAEAKAENEASRAEGDLQTPLEL
ncbi:hypothetical protein Acr_28g0001690 [Actinidia rufa]|uniref:Uncharacterized protein n=1 Tax=Actinidia rufa TaxID=165716 RepID=A0A7J0H9N6_9ERIC|nr:hypothetical protein Acr_28g0001690 [Actinidia rufa]